MPYPEDAACRLSAAPYAGRLEMRIPPAAGECDLRLGDRGRPGYEVAQVDGAPVRERGEAMAWWSCWPYVLSATVLLCDGCGYRPEPVLLTGVIMVFGDIVVAGDAD
jgi:hypothetical protein